MSLEFCLNCSDWISTDGGKVVSFRNGYRTVIDTAGRCHTVITNPRQVEKAIRKAECLKRGLQLPPKTKPDVEVLDVEA